MSVGQLVSFATLDSAGTPCLVCETDCTIVVMVVIGVAAADAAASNAAVVAVVDREIV